MPNPLNAPITTIPGKCQAFSIKVLKFPKNFSGKALFYLKKKAECDKIEGGEKVAFLFLLFLSHGARPGFIAGICRRRSSEVTHEKDNASNENLDEQSGHDRRIRRFQKRIFLHRGRKNFSRHLVRQRVQRLSVLRNRGLRFLPEFYRQPAVLYFRHHPPLQGA